MQTFLRQVRFAVRAFGRSPGFTAIAVLTMALGIGAVSAVFSLVNAILIGGLPFERADQLVFIRGVRLGTTPQAYPLGLMDLDAVDEASDVFAALSPVTGLRPFNLTTGGEAEHVNGEMVGSGFFAALRVPLALGRAFTRDEAASATAQPVVVISDGLWRRRFASSQDVLDTSFELNDRLYRVIGVAPAGFRGMSDEAQIWLPIGMAGAVYGSHYTQTRQFRWLSGVARLRDGVSIAQAGSVVDATAAQLRASFPAENDRLGIGVYPLEDVFFGGMRTPLLALLGASTFVLLIGCVNVANMLLARGHARGPEFALRRVLGASGGTLAGQVLVETLVLSGAGAALGLALAWALPQAALALAPPGMQRFVTINFDVRVAACVVGATLASAVFAGLVPAVLILRHTPGRLLGEGGRGAAGAARHRFQRTLVAGEVALTVALLIGAAAMARGFNRFLSTDLGLSPEGIMTARLDLTAERFKENAPYWAVARDVLSRVATVPGVESAALEGPGFPTSGSYAATFQIVDAARQGDPDVSGLRHHVTPGYFATLGIPITAGRGFDTRDVPGGDRAIIVSQEFAEVVWPGRSPLGERLRAGPGADAPLVTVIGVAANVRHAGRTTSDAWAPDVYLNLFQSPARSPATLTVLARSAGRSDVIAYPLQRAMRESSGGLPPYDVVSLDTRLARQTATPRFAVLVMSTFAVAALLLSAGGVYGVVSYIVGQRTREVGIRMALGSTRTGVVYRMLRLGLIPVGLGAGAGLVAAAWSGRFIASLLYGMAVTDPLHVAGMTGALAIVAIAAALVPALRAARVPPSVSLRRP